MNQFVLILCLAVQVLVHNRCRKEESAALTEMKQSFTLTNATPYTISNIRFLSVSIDKLAVEEKSEAIEVQSLDDVYPTFSLESDGSRFVNYLDIESFRGKETNVILDSLDFDKLQAYYSLK